MGQLQQDLNGSILLIVEKTTNIMGGYDAKLLIERQEGDQCDASLLAQCFVMK